MSDYPVGTQHGTWIYQGNNVWYSTSVWSNFWADLGFPVPRAVRFP